MRAVLHLVDLADELRQIVRDEVAALLAGRDTGSPWLDVDGAAAYMGDTTVDAIRGLVKRDQIPVHRAPNGRLLFDRAELDTWVRGEAA